MTKPTKPAWYGVAAVAIGTGIFFLATNKGRLFKKGTAGLKALLGGTLPAPESGHARDVAATNPPAETGRNFMPHGDGR